MRRNPEEVKRIFSFIARRYDVANDVLSLGLHRLWKRKLVRILSRELGLSSDVLGRMSSNGSRVCDFCCGTGDIVRLLVARLGAKAEIVGVDFCQEMLLHAQERCFALLHARGRNGENVKLIEGDVTSLALPANSFSAITVAFGLRNVSDVGALLREAYRLLEEGGIFLSLEFFRPQGFWTKHVLGLYLRAVVPAVGSLISDNRAAYEYLSNSICEHMTADEFSQLLGEAGFCEVSYTRLIPRNVAIHLAKKPVEGLRA